MVRHWCSDAIPIFVSCCTSRCASRCLWLMNFMNGQRLSGEVFIEVLQRTPLISERFQKSPSPCTGVEAFLRLETSQRAKTAGWTSSAKAAPSFLAKKKSKISKLESAWEVLILCAENLLGFLVDSVRLQPSRLSMKVSQDRACKAFCIWPAEQEFVSERGIPCNAATGRIRLPEKSRKYSQDDLTRLRPGWPYHLIWKRNANNGLNE